VFEFKGKIYAAGGISNNELIWTTQCEGYNIEKNVWEIISYKGFDIPFLTAATVLNTSWSL